MQTQKQTEYAGIDYGLGQSNRNKETGIRFGVIPHHAIGQSWYDQSEAYYGKPDEFECPDCGQTVSINTKGDPEINWGDNVDCPNCGKSNEIELPDFAEPISHFTDNDEISAEQGNDDCDIFVMKSKFFTYAQFCSPCAPGACYLLNPLSSPVESNKAYCFGHDWFEGGKAPYPVYSVETGKLITAEKKNLPCPNCDGTGKDTLARLARVRQCAVSEINVSELHVNNFNAKDGTFDCFRCQGKGTVEETVYS